MGSQGREDQCGLRRLELRWQEGYNSSWGLNKQGKGMGGGGKHKQRNE